MVRSGGSVRWVLVLALLVGACGGSGTPEAEGSDGTASPGGDVSAVAVLEVLTDAVERDAGEGFAAAGSGDEVPAGAVVRTDAAGFGQLDYADGSLARLGPDTTLTVVALADAADEVATELDLGAGRVWNRVRGVTESEGRYEVGTPVAVAGVRGTAFDVACDPAGCTFTVLEGIVDVTLPDGTTITLTAGQRLRIAADGTAGDVDDGGLAPLLADPWIADNLTRDQEAGFPSIEGPADPGPEAAALADILSPFGGAAASAWTGVEPDPLGDWIYSRSDVTPGRTDPYTDIAAWVRSGADLPNPDAAFPCGDDGVRLVVCNQPQFPPGPVTVYGVIFDGDIADGAGGESIYALALRSDDDPSTDWVPQGGFDWDLFRDTDLWVQIIGDPGAANWQLLLSKVTSDQQIQQIGSPARVVVQDNAIVYILPEVDFPPLLPYRFTAFHHPPGQFEPESVSGDVSGANPTEPLQDP